MTPKTPKTNLENTKDKKKYQDATKTVITGRFEKTFHGAVNPPVYHASTFIYPNLKAIRGEEKVPYTYGRRETPTSEALTTALAEIEGGYKALLTPSGVAAIATTLFALVKSGDHILVADTVYEPTKTFCDQTLKRMGVETEYYDPLIGADIQNIIRDTTRVIFTESPGSITFEVQDIPAITAVARKNGIKTVIDNTWASPLYFDPFAHGIDVSIQSATKYVVGHADALLGSICCTQEIYPQIRKTHGQMGQCAGPDDIYLALRGLKTLSTRLKQHMTSALKIAEWLTSLPFIETVFYPALAHAQGHDIWKRDFKGANGLLSFALAPCTQKELAAMLDNMQIFSMGYSWGGFESLILPMTPTRSLPTPIRYQGIQNKSGKPLAQIVRLHIGLEDVDDLKQDLVEGFRRAQFDI